jgi:hypothetical protein
MKELKAIFALLVLLVGCFVLYKVIPALWGNFELGRLVDDQSVVYTYQNKSEADIATAIVDKASAFDVALTPDQVKVVRNAGDLSISVEYTVHVDLPFYPFDMNLKAASKNHNVMK